MQPLGEGHRYPRRREIFGWMVQCSGSFRHTGTGVGKVPERETESIDVPNQTAGWGTVCFGR